MAGRAVHLRIRNLLHLVDVVLEFAVVIDVALLELPLIDLVALDVRVLIIVDICRGLRMA